MTMYAVDVRREERATVFIEADSLEEAEEAAPEVVDSREWWSDEDYEVEGFEAFPRPGQRYWTGGVMGDWATWSPQ